MEIEYKRPKLKDKIYGEMFWEDWDEGECFWYAPSKTNSGGKFDLLIYADSQANFLAVAGTHSTYRRIMENLEAVGDEMIAEIMENSRQLFKKKRQQHSAGEAIKKDLRLYSIKIFSDLSSTIEFIGRVAEDEDPDEKFYAMLDREGNLTEAGIEEM